MKFLIFFQLLWVIFALLDPDPFVSVHDTPWLCFEIPKLQNFDFNADQDPAYKNNADLDSQS